MVEDSVLLSAMRAESSVADLCRAAGITEAEFKSARDAYLSRRLPLANASLKGAVVGRVEILRDGAGVPHVFASATPDLYFGMGFAMAQDRLWQMDRLRRRALGRQAEVLGADFVKSDLIHLTVGIDSIATAEVERTDEKTSAIIEAFVRGINRQIEACGRELPVEFAILDYEPEPFRARDVIAILRGIWWSLNGRLENLVVAEAARLLPDEELRRAYLTPEAPEERIVPPGSPYPSPGLTPAQPSEGLAGMGDNTGSNNWAVADWRTASGHAILCSDPHQAFWLPSSWYECALHGPEDDAVGAGHPGVPGLWWAYNGNIAWGITNNAASTRDLYLEEVDPNDPDQYREAEGWRRFAEREVQIAVRGQQSRRYTVRSTVRGPVVNDVLPSVAEGGDPPLSLRWVGQEHMDDVRAIISLGRARDWQSFKAALRDWAVPVFNFVYADRRGTVGYQCAGRVPIRGRVVRGYRQAGNPQDQWLGYVPFEAMPCREDPASGYVSSANNRVVPDDYPYPFYGAWAAGHRATRIRQGVESSEEFTLEQALALQNDLKSCRAERLCPPLIRLLETSQNEEVRVLLKTLREWDYRYTVDSPAPLLFEAVMQAWQERVAREHFPARLVPLVRSQGGAAARLIEGDDLGWFAEGTLAALAKTAKEAVEQVKQRFGPDPAAWRWGTAHQANWQHPLSNDAVADAFDVGPAPLAGCGDTLCNTGTGLSPHFSADGGVEYRLVVDFSRPGQALAVQNVGNSGQPGSPHYRDQFEPWASGGYHTVYLARTDVERGLEGKTTIRPADS